MTRDAGPPLAPPKSAESPDPRTQLALLDFAPDVLLLVDGNDLISYANGRVREVFHYEPIQLQGQKVQGLVPQVSSVSHRLHGFPSSSDRDPSDRQVVYLKRSTGETFSAEVLTGLIQTGSRVFTAVAVRDVSARSALEHQLRGLQKVEAVGRLAGAVAHDFNNILTAIVSFADAAYQAARSGSPVRANLEEVLASTERARLLTKKLLDFAKRRPVEPIVVDINAVVRATERMVDVLMSKTVQIVRVLSPEVGMVRVDPGGMEQVIVNLCVNACDAMPEGGSLTLETKAVQLTAEEARSRGPNVAPGPYVLLRVTDTGVGMTEEVQGRVFEPFFSTKPPATGTGLGLATCYGLVSQAGGFIDIDSQVGRGTQVEVYLPRAAQPLPSTEPGRATSGTVLIVEYDATVRAVAARELARVGLKPITASGWLEALDAVRDQNGQVDLLLLDLAIPGTDGFELAGRIRRLCPSIRVLFMSQHDPSTLNAKGLRVREEELLRKPFGIPELLAKVGELEEGQGSDGD